MVFFFISFCCAIVHILQILLLSTGSSEKQNILTLSSVSLRVGKPLMTLFPWQYANSTCHSMGQGERTVIYYLTFWFPTAGLPLSNQANKSKIGDNTSCNVELLFSSLFTHVRVMFLLWPRFMVHVDFQLFSTHTHWFYFSFPKMTRIIFSYIYNFRHCAEGFIRY